MADRVIFISGGPTTQALWEPLAERYRLAFLVPQAAQLARQSHLDAISLADFADGDLQETAANIAAHLTHRVVRAMPEIEQRFAKYFDSDCPADLNGNLNGWFAGFCMHHLREQTTRLAAMERLFEQNDVAGCVVHEDVTIDMRAMVDYARAHGVLTIHVPHAPCHLLPEAGPDIHRETRTGWIAASGPCVADWYMKQGFPRERIEITGGPQWDWLYGDLPDRAEARQVLGIHGDKPVILYGTTWTQTTALRSRFEHELDDTLSAVLKLALAWQAVLIVSVHPNDGAQAGEFYARAMEAANVSGLVTRRHASYTVRAADVVIEHGPSNFCIDAAIMGTPSCYVRTDGFDFATALPWRCSVDDLPMTAKEARESAGDPAWDNFISEYNITHPDGGAAEQTAACVERICQ